VYLNFNLSTECARQLGLLAELPGAGIVIVDNASRPEDLVELKAGVLERGGKVIASRSVDVEVAQSVAAGKRLLLIEHGRNAGYSAGNNVALRALHRALGSAGQYLVTNPDVELTADAARSLFAADGDIVGPAIWEHYLQGLRPFEDRCDFGTGFSDGERPPGEEGIGVRLCGCCMKITGAAIEKYGLLPEENFLYDEETRYFERVYRANGRPRYLSEVVVRHAGSAVEGKKGFNYFYYNFRNRLTYFLEVGRPHYRRTGRFLLCYVDWVFGVLKNQLRRGNLVGARGVLAGVRDGLLRRSGPYIAASARRARS
jgi:GT2 family glycosyltransferase